MVDTNSNRADGANTTSYKVIMVGETGVGKTCIVNRLIKG